MAPMADWTDGPEYAPVERPDAFETPDVAPLPSPEIAVRPGLSAPAEQPAWVPPAAPGPELRSLVPTPGPRRDPLQAFDVAASAMTSQSTWGSVHATATAGGAPAWSPLQPLRPTPVTTVDYAQPARHYGPGQVNPATFPPPDQTWFAPIRPEQARPAPQPVTLAQMWSATTSGVLIPLILGGIVQPLSLLMLAVSFSLSSRATHRRRQVRLVYGVAAVALLALGGLSLLDDSVDLPMFFDVVGQWAQLVCWLVGVAVLFVVGAGLRAGEPPDRRP